MTSNDTRTQCEHLQNTFLAKRHLSSSRTIGVGTGVESFAQNCVPGAWIHTLSHTMQGEQRGVYDTDADPAHACRPVLDVGFLHHSLASVCGAESNAGDRERRERACEPFCEPSLRRFEALGDLCLDMCENTAKDADAFCRPAESKGRCFDVDFDFVPVQKEAPLSQSSHEEVLVCKAKVRVSSSFGYAVPRSCGGNTPGSHSLRVSTSSFCSSQDTVVDDSEYRVPARSERKKHCAEEVEVEVLATVVASVVPSGDEDTAFFLRSKAHVTRASRPPLSPPYATSAYNEQLQQPFGYLPQTKASQISGRATPTAGYKLDSILQPPRRETKTCDCRSSSYANHSCLQKTHSQQMPVRQATTESSAVAASATTCWPDENTGNLYPVTVACFSAAKTSSVAAEFRAGFHQKGSLLMPTDHYDYTMKLALSKIQQYRY